MIRKALLALTALLAIGTPVALAAAPANAANATPGCISKVEWRRVSEDMTRPQVTAITGTKGVEDKGARWETKDGEVSIEVEYRQCLKNGKRSPYSWDTVDVQFNNYEWIETTDEDGYWDEYLDLGPFTVSWVPAWYTPGD